MKKSAAQKAGAEAERLHAEAYGQTEIEVYDPAAEPAPEPVNEPTAEPEPVASEPEVAAEPAPEVKAKEGEGAETWEQRYKTLQGMWKKDVPTLQTENQRLQGQMADLERKLQDMELAKAAPQAPEAPERLVTDEEIAEYGPELVDIVRRAAKEELSPELARIKAENERLQARLEGMGETVADTTRQRMLNEMDTRLLNWREINQSPDFLAWLQEPDPYSGQRKQDMLTSAFNNNDVNRTCVFFERYNSETEAINTEEPATRSPQVDVDKLVAPGTPRSGGAPRVQQADTKVWTEREISQFYNDAAKGKYRSERGKAEKERIEKQIHAAAMSNRVKQSFTP